MQKSGGGQIIRSLLIGSDYETRQNSKETNLKSSVYESGQADRVRGARIRAGSGRDTENGLERKSARGVAESGGGGEKTPRNPQLLSGRRLLRAPPKNFQKNGGLRRRSSRSATAPTKSSNSSPSASLAKATRRYSARSRSLSTSSRRFSWAACAGACPCPG